MHECNYACVVLDCFQFFGCSCNGWCFGSLLDRSRVVSLLLSLSVVCSGLCGPDSSVTTSMFYINHDIVNSTLLLIEFVIIYVHSPLRVVTNAGFTIQSFD